MTTMSMKVSEELAEQLRPLGPWLPTIIELGLVGFTTLATAAATSEEEQRELDELNELEHILIMLKTQVTNHQPPATSH